MAWLIYEDKNGKKREVEVAKPSFVIGKRKDCDLVLDHLEVSRRHLEISNNNGIFSAKDLGSTNGSRVNGDRLLAPKLLGDGTVIELGALALVFALEKGGGAAAGGARASAPAAAASTAPGKTAPPTKPAGGKPAAAEGRELSADDLMGKPLPAWLKRARDLGASDLHLTCGAPPFVRLHGHIRYFKHPPFTLAEIDRFLGALLSSEQLENFRRRHDLDFCCDIKDIGRFRANVHAHNGGLGVSLRVLSERVPTLKELGLPDTLRKFTQYNQGLVLVTGPAGCGKSSTMAALVEIVNREKRKQVITLEDPIEYVFESKNSTVIQRQIHVHTESWSGGLRAALREDPDVIMVGEMRDLETISVAITAAETGHLVFGTLHTLGSTRTIDRILDVFPPKEQPRIRIMLSESLRGVISQQLVPTLDGTRRLAALEILFSTPAVANLIREEKTHQLLTQLQTGKSKGQRIMDESLAEMLDAGLVTRAEVQSRADDPRRFDEEITIKSR
ncbi:MAG: PilT/PilU family type 4a pilus ATPase [Planctomycetes bacterium]|nr:PilT/PilU family type 4a pilus ATPase [Planctomycetota bacterium]